MDFDWTGLSAEELLQNYGIRPIAIKVAMMAV
jgi:hypothetical protein